MRLYYLTGAQYGLSNLALRRVKISRFSDLNDPFELLAVDLKERAHRKIFRDTRDSMNERNGLICLSRLWTNPLIWGHYAERHTGMALGFDVPDHIPSSVLYAKSPEKIQIDNKTNKPVLTEDLMKRLLRTKFHDWKYEDEMRIFVGLGRKTRESGLYFHDFSPEFQLREVILGPKCELPLKSVRVLVEGYKPAASVIKARIAFSSFQVIEHKVATRQK